MMSVGRLIIFDVTALLTFEAAKLVAQTNQLSRPVDMAVFSPRIVIVGDMAKTEKAKRNVSYD